MTLVAASVFFLERLRRRRPFFAMLSSLGVESAASPPGA